MMRLKEVALSNASPEAKIAGLAVLLDKELLRLSEVVLNTKKLQGPQGEQGLQGPKGEQGDRGFDGTNGKDGSDGKDGKDGHEGKDGVGVQDAKIDFDGSLVITLTNGREINAGDVVPEGVADKIKVIKSGGGNSQTVLDAIEEIQATIATYGTMATQNANAVAITGGSINGTTIGATTASTGVFTTLTATGQTSLGGAAGSEAFRAVPFASQTSRLEVTGGVNGGNVKAYVAGTGSTELWVSSLGTGAVRFQTNAGATEQMRVSNTASAVNYVQVTGGSTGNYPSIVGTGSDASVGLQLAGKGGTIDFRNNGVGTAVQFSVAFTSSSVNYLSATGSGVSGNAPRLYALGSDTNIPVLLQSKGTGAIDLAAGSKGVNISNGGTVTALTRTAGGNSYTSVPLVAISAPTTAGGTTATASCVVTPLSLPTIVSGGTGYTVGDVLTFVGGTGTAYQAVVNTVSGGVITGIGTQAAAAYSVVPSNPISVTGGTGSGATFSSVNYTVTTTGLTITNAGSGYVEQPTVSFSGGGGSGAAAFATVGSGVTFRGIGSSISLAVDSGEAVRVGNRTYLTTNYIAFYGNSGSSAAEIRSEGSGSALDLQLLSKSTGSIRCFTNGTAYAEQFRVSHTASAVNYVQVTGAATGGATVISAQGSDANAGLWFQAKGTGNIRFDTRAGASIGFLIADSGSAVNANWMQVTGAAASSAPALSVAGTDTNIDLTLTPKGTGNVRFGTYTANMALVIQGYIEIKDSGGTVRKLAVIA